MAESEKTGISGIGLSYFIAGDAKFRHDLLFLFEAENIGSGRTGGEWNKKGNEDGGEPIA
jgi:hypothetical protein